MQKLIAINFQPPVAYTKTSEAETLKQKIMVAELKLSVFFAEHNIGTQMVDHLVKMFLIIQISQRYKL